MLCDMFNVYNVARLSVFLFVMASSSWVSADQVIGNEPTNYEVGCRSLAPRSFGVYYVDISNADAFEGKVNEIRVRYWFENDQGGITGDRGAGEDYAQLQELASRDGHWVYLMKDYELELSTRTIASRPNEKTTFFVTLTAPQHYVYDLICKKLP